MLKVFKKIKMYQIGNYIVKTEKILIARIKQIIFYTNTYSNTSTEIDTLF